MSNPAQEFLTKVNDLANEGEDGDQFNFQFNFPGGAIEIFAKKVLDPLPDNVIQFPR